MAQGIDLLYTHIVKCEPNMLLSLCIYNCTTYEHLLCIYSRTCMPGPFLCIFLVFCFSISYHMYISSFELLQGRPGLDQIDTKAFPVHHFAPLGLVAKPLPQIGWSSKPLRITLQGINISHLGRRKIIFKMPFLGDILVPWRVIMEVWFRWFSFSMSGDL